MDQNCKDKPRYLTQPGLLWDPLSVAFLGISYAFSMCLMSECTSVTNLNFVRVEFRSDRELGTLSRIFENSSLVVIRYFFQRLIASHLTHNVKCRSVTNSYVTRQESCTTSLHSAHCTIHVEKVVLGFQIFTKDLK